MTTPQFQGVHRSSSKGDSPAAMADEWVRYEIVVKNTFIDDVGSQPEEEGVLRYGCFTWKKWLKSVESLKTLEKRISNCCWRYSSGMKGIIFSVFREWPKSNAIVAKCSPRSL